MAVVKNTIPRDFLPSSPQLFKPGLNELNGYRNLWIFQLFQVLGTVVFLVPPKIQSAEFIQMKKFKTNLWLQF